MERLERDPGESQSTQWEVRHRHDHCRLSSSGRLRISTPKLVRLGDLVRSLYDVEGLGWSQRELGWREKCSTVLRAPCGPELLVNISST